MMTIDNSHKDKSGKPESRALYACPKCNKFHTVVVPQDHKKKPFDYVLSKIECCEGK